jgi:aspartate/tyrosine/aromatic aminotransferase
MVLHDVVYLCTLYCTSTNKMTTFSLPNQVNVGVGAYRCDQGMPFVLPVVREAENEINIEELDHEYSGIVSVICSLFHFDIS